jgi:hypothetical protein
MNGLPTWLAALPRCPATGKVAHEDKAGAKRHARAMHGAGEKGAGQRMSAYQCGHCLLWHTGRQSSATDSKSAIRAERIEERRRERLERKERKRRETEREDEG